jgi:capsule polysaccharide export protein KpsE/RkpR
VIFRPFLAVLAVVALAGCAADPAPNEQIRLTQQALEQANAVGANSDESSELKLAEGKFAQAQADMADQSYKNARMQAEQAELDARLAEAQVLTRKSQEQLNVLNTRITRLRKQLQLGEAQ